MRQHNGARVLSSDVSSGPDLRPPWSLVRTGDRDPAMPRPENATIGIPQSCRYALPHWHATLRHKCRCFC